jgi:hypothetical protein
MWHWFIKSKKLSDTHCARELTLDQTSKVKKGLSTNMAHLSALFEDTLRELEREPVKLLEKSEAVPVNKNEE